MSGERLLKTIARGMDHTFKVSDAGHFTDGNCVSKMGCETIIRTCVYKTRLNILSGRWYPDTQKDVLMLRDFQQSKMTPEEFLEVWS